MGLSIKLLKWMEADSAIAITTWHAGPLKTHSIVITRSLPPRLWGQQAASVHQLTSRLACRFRGLLAADNGEQEVESLAEECSEDIKQVKAMHQRQTCPSADLILPRCCQP